MLLVLFYTLPLRRYCSLEHFFRKAGQASTVLAGWGLASLL
jgi:hypothetical protein